MKLFAIFCLVVSASAQSGPPHLVTLEATGTEEVRPQLYHVLMKMERAAGQAADASAGGEKQVRDFLAAVEALKIPEMKWRVTNHVYGGPANRFLLGTSYSRNIVFTLPNTGSSADRDRIVAQIQDLGAKYDSHCVTCIGSG